MNTEQMKATEYYGSVKGMPAEILRKRLSKAQEEVSELSAEKERRSAFTAAELLADRLHRLLHFGVDCDYYYSDWPSPTGCRAEFHSLAQQAEHWYYTVADEKRTKDYPLGQLVAYMEILIFGQDFV